MYHRIRNLAIVALTATLVGGFATAAQAYEPRQVSEPGCFVLDCDAKNMYDSVLAHANAAIASKDPATRTSFVSQTFFEVYGDALATWQDNKIATAPNTAILNQDKDSFEKNPTDAQIACYANVYLTHIASANLLDGTVKDMYQIIEDMKEVKNIYGDYEDESEIREAFGDADTMQSVLGEIVKPEQEQTIEAVTELPLSPADLYFEIIAASEQPVENQTAITEFQNSPDPLIGCMTNQGNLQDSVPVMPSYITKTAIVKYNATALLSTAYGYGSKHTSGCSKTKAHAWTCNTPKVKYDQTETYSAAILSTTRNITRTNAGTTDVKVPSAALNVLQYQGNLERRVTIRFSKLHGAADFMLSDDHGYQDYRLKKAGTYSSTWIALPNDLGPGNIVDLTGVNIGLDQHTQATITSAQIQYRYTVLH